MSRFARMRRLRLLGRLVGVDLVAEQHQRVRPARRRAARPVCLANASRASASKLLVASDRCRWWRSGTSRTPRCSARAGSSVRIRQGGYGESGGGQTTSPSSLHLIGRAASRVETLDADQRVVVSRHLQVCSRCPSTSTVHGPSVSTQTVASVRPTWRSRGPRTSAGMKWVYHPTRRLKPPRVFGRPLHPRAPGGVDPGPLLRDMCRPHSCTPRGQTDGRGRGPGSVAPVG